MSSRLSWLDQQITSFIWMKLEMNQRRNLSKLKSPYFDPKEFRKIIFDTYKLYHKGVFRRVGVVLWELSKEKGSCITHNFKSLSPYNFGRKSLNYFVSCLQGGLKGSKYPFLYYLLMRKQNFIKGLHFYCAITKTLPIQKHLIWAIFLNLPRWA